MLKWTLTQNSQIKTYFSTHSGSYQWLRMPLCLKGTPCTYQMLMQIVLRGLNWKILLAYLDDILFISNSYSEHLAHLSLVLQCLREANLTLQPEKCSFVAKKVQYLGHIISPAGLAVNPKNIEVVANYPQPKNIKNVRAFLGLY